MTELWPWLALVLLGAFHGLNPAMGWLFAVARGLQEKRLAAVVEALVPIAIGHAISVALVVVLIRGAELAAAPQVLRMGAAAALILFGAFKLFRPGVHPRWVGMRVGLGELGVWSFLMATAHGAGLMLFPVLMSLPGSDAHAGHLAGEGSATTLVALSGTVVLVHTLAMLVSMGIVAVVVYAKLGLAILRSAWLNLDLLWAFTIVVTGILTLFT